ncbi:MAG TPA: hypothetical protein VKB17_05860 [Thermoleophilaceae bacterium]|nr:hypothetical protein [Thermoleophilaceae bacterium]
MDLRRLRAGEWIVSLSGIALLVSLFLPWYEPDRTAWEALAVSDVILLAVAAAALCVFVATATQRVPAVPIALEAIVALLGIVAAIVVMLRVIWLPDPADGREWGLWLGLVGALGVAAGGWVGVRDDRPASFGGRPPPDVEPLPAPRP